MVCGVLVLAGCVRHQARGSQGDTGSRYWETGLEAALAAASEGRFTDADRTLIEAGSDDESTPAGLETLYWRALLHLNPANKAGSPATAAAYLDRYLRADDAPRRREAALLRDLAHALKSRPSGDEETEKLRAELTKTQEELERIKRRLSQPRS